MKAMVYTRYGPPEVLQLKEVEKPASREDDVLARRSLRHRQIHLTGMP
jgi:NADPH:quinone reductase-like Zn-dependent oxidoreductase